MKRTERLELNSLSLKATGRSSYWHKLLNNGVSSSDMVEIKDDGTERKYKGVYYLTLDEVKAKLAVLLKEKEAKEALAAKKAEDEAAKKREEVIKTLEEAQKPIETEVENG